MNVVGLDLSLTATGICDSETANVYKSKKAGMERLIDLREFVLMMTTTCPHDACLVVVEGFSYASPNQAHQLGGLGYVVRLALYEARIPYVDVPPTTLKKFATSKGNANKSAMGLAAARNGYDGPGDDNAIDAWWLRQLGLCRYGAFGVTLTDYREEATAKIEWPDVAGGRVGGGAA